VSRGDKASLRTVSHMQIGAAARFTREALKLLAQANETVGRLRGGGDEGA
jgi:hypothetical protein